MADVTLKNRGGENVAFTNVKSVELQSADGETVEYYEAAALTAPASEENVLTGKEFRLSDGTVHTGTMPERSEEDITCEWIDDVNFAVTIPEGYYPETVYNGYHDSSGVSGNAILAGADFVLAEGVGIGSDVIVWNNVAAMMAKWHTMWYAICGGADLYYMPATVAVEINGSLVLIEGAWASQGAPVSSLPFSGHSIDGGTALSFTVTADTEGALTISGVVLTVNGAAAAIPDGGFNAKMLVTTPLG